MPIYHCSFIGKKFIFNFLDHNLLDAKFIFLTSIPFLLNIGYRFHYFTKKESRNIVTAGVYKRHTSVFIDSVPYQKLFTVINNFLLCHRLLLFRNRVRDQILHSVFLTMFAKLKKKDILPFLSLNLEMPLFLLF